MPTIWRLIAGGTRRLWSAKDGSTAVEYAVLGAVVSAAIFTSLVLFGRWTEHELQALVAQQNGSSATTSASAGTGTGTSDGQGGDTDYTSGSGDAKPIIVPKGTAP